MGSFNEVMKSEGLRSLVQRARVGARLTLLAVNLHGTDQAMEDELIGVSRVIRSVHDDHVRFDPYGVAGERRSCFFWPDHLPKEGFLGMIASAHGVLAGFIDDNTFVIDDRITYSVYRLDEAPKEPTALAYLHGLGVEKDHPRALRMFLQDADRGDKVAMNNIGVIYKCGYGVTVDYAEAMRWFNRAADVEGAANLNIARLYEGGLGVPLDRLTAYQYYSRAKRLGVADAGNEQTRLLNEMSLSDRLRAKLSDSASS